MPPLEGVGGFVVAVVVIATIVVDAVVIVTFILIIIFVVGGICYCSVCCCCCCCCRCVVVVYFILIVLLVDLIAVVVVFCLAVVDRVLFWNVISVVVCGLLFWVFAGCQKHFAIVILSRLHSFFLCQVMFCLFWGFSCCGTNE